MWVSFTTKSLFIGKHVSSLPCGHLLECKQKLSSGKLLHHLFFSWTNPKARESATVVSSLNRKKWRPKIKVEFSHCWLGTTSRTVIGDMVKCKDSLEKFTVQVALQTLHSFTYLATYSAYAMSQALLLGPDDRKTNRYSPCPKGVCSAVDKANAKQQAYTQIQNYKHC